MSRCGVVDFTTDAFKRVLRVRPMMKTATRCTATDISMALVRTLSLANC